MEKIEQYETFEMHINDAIALCHILDDFEEFNKNAIEFVDNENKNVLAVRNWAEGDTLGANVVAKRFYENNKALIDKIHQYTDISNFINRNYNFDYGSNFSDNKRNNIVIFYNYLIRNRHNLDKVLAVLNRLDELGFDDINFNENISFDNQVYYFNKKMSQFDFYFLDGDISIEPNYNEDLISYKSIGSNYLMKLHFYQTFSKYRVITLNSLVFDVNNLPKEELTFYETVQKIIVSQKENENIDKFIRNAVSLECALLAMTSVINKLDGIIQNLSKVEDKDKGLELTAKAKDTINGLFQFLEGFEERELKQNNISKKVLEEQKLIYKRNEENN